MMILTPFQFEATCISIFNRGGPRPRVYTRKNPKFPPPKKIKSALKGRGQHLKKKIEEIFVGQIKICNKIQIRLYAKIQNSGQSPRVKKYGMEKEERKK